MKKVNTSIKFYIFEQDKLPNFGLKFSTFWTIFAQKGYFLSKREKVNKTIEFAYSN